MPCPTSKHTETNMIRNRYRASTFRGGKQLASILAHFHSTLDDMCRFQKTTLQSFVFMASSTRGKGRLNVTGCFQEGKTEKLFKSIHCFVAVDNCSSLQPVFETSITEEWAAVLYQGVVVERQISIEQSFSLHHFVLGYDYDCIRKQAKLSNTCVSSLLKTFQVRLGVKLPDVATQLSSCLPPAICSSAYTFALEPIPPNCQHHAGRITDSHPVKQQAQTLAKYYGSDKLQFISFSVAAPQVVLPRPIAPAPIPSQIKMMIPAPAPAPAPAPVSFVPAPIAAPAVEAVERRQCFEARRWASTPAELLTRVDNSASMPALPTVPLSTPIESRQTFPEGRSHSWTCPGDWQSPYVNGVPAEPSSIESLLVFSDSLPMLSKNILDAEIDEMLGEELFSSGSDSEWSENGDLGTSASIQPDFGPEVMDIDLDSLRSWSAKIEAEDHYDVKISIDWLQ